MGERGVKERPMADDAFLLHDAIGEMLVKLLGEEAGWILTYVRGDGPVQVVSTLPAENVIAVYESQIEALRQRRISPVVRHETGGDPV
jgi:hypothetical protein